MFSCSRLFNSLPIVTVLALTACSGDIASPAPSSGAGGPIRQDGFCNLAGLSASLRQTFIIIDENSLKPAQTGEQFVAQNASVRDAVLAFANPSLALSNGRSAPRERVNLLLAPADGSSPRQIFTGCLPGLSAAERNEAAKSESAVGKFFSGGQLRKLEEDMTNFSNGVAGALVNAARAISGTTSGSALYGSLAATGPIFRSNEAIPRVVLISDQLFPSKAGSIIEARKSALDDAGKTSFDLGNAEVIAIGQGGNNETARAWLQTYLLRMNGKLVSWSPDAGAVASTPAPVSIRRFSGTIKYPVSGEQIINLRLTQDANGKLVNSWMIKPGAPYDRSVPLTGQAICTDASNCKMQSDNEGFDQVWVTLRAGSDLKFSDDAPFGGMREWKLETTADAVSGEIFDSAIIQIGLDPAVKSLPFKASLQPKANF
jgi:hypothetical protein